MKRWSRIMMVSSDRLNMLLKPQGFFLDYADTSSKIIVFVRPSSIHRLYEHLIIHGQGRKGEAAYAITAVSASNAYCHDPFSAERGRSLLFALETDTERHWTIVTNKRQAQEWEKKLSQLADSYCRATTEAKGPSLSERLQPVFAAVDQYIDKIGDVNKIFDSECQFCSLAAEELRQEAERLASGLGFVQGSTEDIQLACIFLVMFGPEVERQLNPFLGKKVREDPYLRARIQLLIDYFRDQRKAYWATHS